MLKIRIKHVLNEIRNCLLFGVCYRWVKKGNGVHCQWSTRFWSPHRQIVLGDNVGIGRGCLFQADITIGNNVLIACNVAFLNKDDHRYDLIGQTMWDSGRGDKYDIVVSDDVWIGHGAIILSPVRIGRGAIVASGSVVVKDVPAYAIIGGNPARVIKMRFTSEQIEEHEQFLDRISANLRSGHSKPSNET